MTEEHPLRSFAMRSDSDVGKAVQRAADMFALRDADGVDAEYERAVGFAGDEPELRQALAFDHVARLWLLDSTKALRRCDSYLREFTTGEVEFRSLRAEILSSSGRFAEAAEESRTTAEVSRARRRPLSHDERARLARVEAYWAAAQGDVDEADALLGEAREAFRSTDNSGGVAYVDGDRRTIGHAPRAAGDHLPSTVAGRLALAAACREQLRYESALAIVRGVLDDEEFDPGLRPPVLYECYQLLRLTRQHDAAARLLPRLREEAASSGDRELLAVLACLSAGDVPGPSHFLRPGRRLECVAELVRRQRFPEAGALLREVYPDLHSDRDTATWHLLSARVALSWHTGEQPILSAAVEHLDTAIRVAAPLALTEIRVQALRLAGETAYQRGDGDRAAECWSEAYALEERIAERQESEEVRLGIVTEAATEHDSMVTAAGAAAARTEDDAATAAVVVAMEIARGRLGPAPAGDRPLPSPLDLVACRQWVSEVTSTLSRRQAVWFTHVTPERVHHAVVARDLLRHISFPLRIEELTAAVDRHRGCWSNPQVLEISLVTGEFENSLAQVAALAGLHGVAKELPSRIRRVAVVVARELADIPLPAVVLPGTDERFVHRFAFSDLPSLSVRHHLRERARGQRGQRQLCVRPGRDTAVAHDSGRTLLAGRAATVSGLSTELANRDHHLLRIDTHGRYDEADPTSQSWLQLAPEGAAGRLTPEGLARLDLRGCGTVVLGACESGREEHRGREARTGFARSAMDAGASAVVAARWVAHDATTAALLDRFLRYLRAWPRDVALQRAQADTCEVARGMPADVSFHRHPARWACWVLYGNPDHQTRAGAITRLLCRVPNLWRRVP
ncbi:CHAT domain-containing protein [Actinophytocola sp.]|uniref:CHAT domain-containing protein n=1 Tax=Actinophytocola sp. TaxID=1872138 RepID=UPI002ED21AF9